MTAEAVMHQITHSYRGLAPKATWGETSLFYNPDNALKTGVYFATIKDHDGENDKASCLNREGVFRLSFGLPPASYEERFGPRPERPDKGAVVATGHDFTELDELTPHPVYAWMGWVQVLSPTERTVRDLRPLLDDAYNKARTTFERRIAKSRARKDA
jgi:hypothetical protein